MLQSLPYWRCWQPATIGRAKKENVYQFWCDTKNYFRYLFVCRRFQHLHRFSCQRAGALKFVNYLLNVFSGWDTIFQRSLCAFFFYPWPLYSYHWHRNIFFANGKSVVDVKHFSDWGKKMYARKSCGPARPQRAGSGKKNDYKIIMARQKVRCLHTSVRSLSNVSTPKVEMMTNGRVQNNVMPHTLSPSTTQLLLRWIFAI